MTPKPRSFRKVSVAQVVRSLLIGAVFFSTPAFGQDPHGHEPVHLNDEPFYCGTTPEFIGEMNSANRGGGGGTPITSFPAGLIMQCGFFRLYFEDQAMASGLGFDAGGGVGATRRNTACQVFTYLSDVLATPPGGALIDVHFNQSAVLGGGALARGGTFFPPALIASGGISGGYAFMHITTGSDPDPSEYDGEITVDFASFNWLNDPSAQFTTCQVDLFSILLHEATHCLGWLSLLTEDTGTQLPASTFVLLGNGPLFTEYDNHFLYYGNVYTGGPYTKILDVVTLVPFVFNLLSTPVGLLSQNTGVWLYGSGQENTDQPIYSPGGFLNGTSLSHFDGTQYAFEYQGHMSPGYSPDYVMVPAYTTLGIRRRTYSLPELRALEVLGYTLGNITTTNSINGTDNNGWLINSNTPSYTTITAGLIPAYGASPSWPDTDMPADFTMANDCGAQLQIDFASRPELLDDEGDILRVLPGSLFNMRGTGNGGNNHAQLTLASLPNGDVITFTPRPDFVGRAQFGFHLWDGHEMGQFVVYTIDVTSGACSTCDPMVELAINGDFEEGTEVALQSNEALGNTMYRDIRYGRSRYGEHYSDGHPRNDQSYIPLGGGSFIRDAVRSCPTATPMNDGFGLGFFNFPNANHPNAYSGDRFNALDGWTNATELCQPLQNCARYRLSMRLNFDFIPDAPGSVIPVTIGFVNDVLDLDYHPYAYQYSFPLDLVVPPSGSGWVEQVVEFYYCGPSADILNIERADWHSFQDQIHLDDISIRLAPAPLVVNAGPDVAVTADCGSGACVDLSATLNVLTGCGLTYSWSPAIGLSDPNVATPTACPTTTTTYTVTVTDASGNTATDEVTVEVIQTGCFTITKTVNDEFTYSGAPILYTITVCNNTTLTQNVVLTDAGLSNFVVTGMTLNGAPFGWPGFPSAPVTLPNVPAGGCATIEIAGYFTAIGTYANCATADPANEDPVSDCAEPVVVQQNCPLMVSGWGDCVNGPVHLCLSVHSLIVDVKTIDFLWVFPSFLQPPTIAGAIIPAAAGGLNGASTISAEQPWTPMPGWSYVSVHLVYNNPISTAGVYSLLCVDVVYDGAPTSGVNVYQTFATNAVPYTINNHVTLLDAGGLPIQPGGFWTNPANIILLGCPGVPMIDASFTVDVPNCGGAVSVHGNLTDPGAIHMWTWGDDRTTPTNGAQDYLYDYFAAIPLNQTPAYTVPPAPPGTYTITHTVILNGVASTSSQIITLYECCQAAVSIPDGSLASVVGTVFSGTVDIQGQFIVDDDVLFQNCQVYMEPGSEIVVQNGWTLDIDNASFTACNGIMWKSITAEDGSTVRIRRSYMDDAESTIAALDGSVVWVDRTQFHNNRVGVGIPDNGLPYNNVACWVANSTFYSAGPMPQPYAGQTTAVGSKGFAAVDVNNTSLDFTAGGNIIHSLSNGIVGHRSDMSVAGCTILNIQPDAAYAYAGNGAGIYARGGHGFFTLKQQGYGKYGIPSFNGCRWGVYTEYMNVRSIDNNMVDMGTAYRVDRSGYMFVDILNNKVRTKYNGMDFRTNDGAAHLLAQDNDITFGDYPTCVGCKPYHAIYVSEGNMANIDSRIQNNTIHFLPLSTSGIGIGLYAADDWLVAGNDLQMTSNAFNRTGILTNGCNRPEVSCNTVNSTGTTYPIDAQAAIRNNMGKEPLISCNSVDHTANGILFNGVAYNTDIRGNFFHNHRWPLHLDATAIIDAQVLKGNLWDPAATTPVWGAWYEVSNAQAVLYQFLYNPATIGGGSTQPPSWSPSSWFNFTFGTNYDCANHHGMEYCSQFHDERCKDCLRELDEKIAGDSLENDPYTDETKWMLKGALYKKLDDAPALLDSLPLLADFYADLQGSTTAAFKAISDGQLVFYNLDSTVVAQLQENRTQIEGMLGLVKIGLGQLGDSTLTPAQRQAVLTSISGYRENIRDLSTWNATALQVASASKVLTADGVKAANASVTTSELIEANEKVVNEIYLATVGKDVDAFTSDQASELFDIANQCPMVGGNAVFKARSLYWLIDDTYDFDDALLCLPHGIIVKSLMEHQANAVSVIPNPAGDEATLVLDRTLDEPGVFVVFDALGSEVMRSVVPLEMPRMTINTSSLAPALYHYQVRGPSGIIGDGKITIVR
jgi:hypothetical protein